MKFVKMVQSKNSPRIIDAYKDLQRAQYALKVIFDADFISKEKYLEIATKLEDLTSMLYAPVYKQKF